MPATECPAALLQHPPRAQQLESDHGLEFTRFAREFAVMNPHDDERLLL